MNTLILFLSLVLGNCSLVKEHTDTSILNINISKYDKINVYNTGGAIKVNANYSNDKAVIRSTRKIEATTNKKLKRAITEIYLDTMSMDGELYIYIVNPSKTLSDQNGKYLSYRSNHHDGQMIDGIKSTGIKFEFELDLELPEYVDAVVSTHKGDIELSGVKGDLAVLNHFGNINIDGVHKVEYVHSHHGELNVKFDRQPNNDIIFVTHHGDISVSFNSTPSVQLDLSSYHGSFFTDFDWAPSPNQTLKKIKDGKTQYKVGKTTNVQIGGGKYLLKFRSHHGNMHILKH